MAVRVLIVLLRGQGFSLLICRGLEQILCTDCGLGEGQVASVCANLSIATFSTVEPNGFSRFCPKDPSIALGVCWCLLCASGELVGASWVTPGCLLGAPGSPLSCVGSWVPPPRLQKETIFSVKTCSQKEHCNKLFFCGKMEPQWVPKVRRIS